VLHGLDLEIHPGETVGVLGESGCGKTTLLRVIAGLVTPSAGRIEIGGTCVCDEGTQTVGSESRKVGLVFQEYALFPHMTVAQNVAFGLGKRQEDRLRDMLSLVGITDLSDRLPRSLSGGQQQRVALARALAPAPDLLLLDEPFANVDRARTGALGDSLRRITKKTNTATLLVTHDRTNAMALSDRLVVLARTDHGATVAQAGDPQSIYQRPASQEVARLTGAAFFLRGTGRGARIETRLGRLDLVTAHEGATEVVLRPEQIAFLPNDQGNSTVRAVVFEGTHTRLVCDSPVGEIHAHVPPDSAPDSGTRGFLSIRGAVWALPKPEPTVAEPGT
jgi:iron(III) transport system ATP-binding protein